MNTCSKCKHYSENIENSEYEYGNRCVNSLFQYTYHDVKPETVIQIEPDEGWGMYVHKPEIFGCTLFEEIDAK